LLIEFFGLNQTINTLNMKGTNQMLPGLPGLFKILHQSNVIRQFDCSFDLINDGANRAPIESSLRRTPNRLLQLASSAIISVINSSNLSRGALKKSRPRSYPA
jgi:hypothetical protein